jgi:hypothetical protein
MSKMTLYRTRPLTVEAVQWNKPGDHPEVMTDKYDHSWLRDLRVRKGDFIVTDPGLPSRVLSTSDFHTRYEPVEGKDG